MVRASKLPEDYFSEAKVYRSHIDRIDSHLIYPWSKKDDDERVYYIFLNDLGNTIELSIHDEAWYYQKNKNPYIKW